MEYIPSFLSCENFCLIWEKLLLAFTLDTNQADCVAFLMQKSCVKCRDIFLKKVYCLCALPVL